MRSMWIIAAVGAASLSAATAFGAGSPVVARVNGTAITEAQLKEMSERVASVQAGEPAAEGAAPVARDELLETLIDLEILSQAAKAEKVDVTPAEVDAQLSEIKAQFAKPEEFKEALKRAHTTEAALRKDIEKQLRLQKLMEKHVSVTVAPETIERYYQDNAERFRHPEEVRASHILFRVEPGGDTAGPRQRAEETLQRLKQGADFAAVATELSGNPDSIQNNGDLGFFARDGAPKAISDVAFSLKPGEMSEIVESPFGLHIIKVTESRPAGMTPLEEVRPQLQQALEDQERARQGQAYIDGLKKKAKIEIVKNAKK